MLKKVGSVSVYVADQDRAKAFYTEKLGMELRMDAPLFPGATNRWLTVAPAGAETDIVLYLPDKMWEHYAPTVGKAQNITLEVEDIASYVATLKERGVHFKQELTEEFWGTYATIFDSEENQILLTQSK